MAHTLGHLISVVHEVYDAALINQEIARFSHLERLAEFNQLFRSSVKSWRLWIARIKSLNWRVALDMSIYGLGLDATPRETL